MKRLAFLALLLLVPALPAAENPAGNWKLKLPAQGGKFITFLMAFSEAEGKWVGDFLGTNAQIKADPKVTSLKIDGDHISYNVAMSPEVVLSYDGVIAKGGKKISGTLTNGSSSPILADMHPSKLKKVGDAYEMAKEDFEQMEGGQELFEAGFIVIGS